MTKWIEREILSEINQAVGLTDGSTWVYYIHSGGGEGKTIMLRQVGLGLDSEDGIRPSLKIQKTAADIRYSGILDLYHSEINTNSGLENRLIASLAQKNEFRDFLADRQVFAKRRESGLVGHELETARQNLAASFARGFNKVSQASRVVVAIDTTERIQFEMDGIQVECDIPGEATTVRDWLVFQLNQWQNCVVLLVGRPEEPAYLGKALRDSLLPNLDKRYVERELGGFSQDEADLYYQGALADPAYPGLKDELTGEFRNRLREAVNGSPIRLELAMEVIRCGYDFEDLKDAVYAGQSEEIRKKIDRLLIDNVFPPAPDDKERQVMRYLAAARKGLSLDLLLHLVQDGKHSAAWKQAFKDLSQRFFVKIPAGDDEKRLFLHDEMYKFCDRYWFRSDELQILCARIAAWYDLRMAECKEEKERKELEIDSLIYRLRADPVSGYHWYVQHAEFAIRGAETGYDLRLRNELINFLKSESPRDEDLLKNYPRVKQEWERDSVANWVKRLAVRGDNSTAVKVFDYISQKKPDLYDTSPEGILSNADKDVFAGASLMYSNEVSRAVEVMSDVIRRLEGDRQPDQVAEEKVSPYLDWRRNLILGRAHNNLGYAYWMYWQRLTLALQEFKAALPYFIVSGLKEEEANTDDNMARVHAQLRHQTRAEALVDEGLDIRKKLKRSYREALSQVSKAIIYLEFGSPHRSQRLCEQAIRTFTLLDVKRGLGLAKTVLARTKRELAKLRPDLYDYEACLDLLNDAVRLASEARNTFETEVIEPVRAVEAINELGCIYREWARVILDELKEKEGVTDLHYGISAQAIQHLSKAIELSRDYDPPIMFIDSSEDLAEVYLLRGEYKEAEDCLLDAESRIGDIYKLKHGKLVDVPAEIMVELSWLMLGKIEYARGDLVFERETNGGKDTASLKTVMRALEHYMASTMYFDKFSERSISPQLRSTFHHIYQRIQPLSFQDKQYLAQYGMREVAQRLEIEVDRFVDFYEGTIGLAISKS